MWLCQKKKKGEAVGDFTGQGPKSDAKPGAPTLIKKIALPLQPRKGGKSVITASRGKERKMGKSGLSRYFGEGRVSFSQSAPRNKGKEKDLRDALFGTKCGKKSFGRERKLSNW